MSSMIERLRAKRAQAKAGKTTEEVPAAPKAPVKAAAKKPAAKPTTSAGKPPVKAAPKAAPKKAPSAGAKPPTTTAKKPTAKKPGAAKPPVKNDAPKAKKPTLKKEVVEEAEEAAVVEEEAVETIEETVEESVEIYETEDSEETGVYYLDEQLTRPCDAEGNEIEVEYIEEEEETEVEEEAPEETPEEEEVVEEEAPEEEEQTQTENPEPEVPVGEDVESEKTVSNDRGRITVNSQYKESGKIVSETDDVSEISVHKFETVPAHVTVRTKNTFNLGDYNSRTIEVGVSLPCYREEIDNAILTAYNIADAKLQQLADQEGLLGE